MHSTYNDISYLKGNFDILQDSALLCAYFNVASKELLPVISYGKFIVYKAMVDLLWTLWGGIKTI